MQTEQILCWSGMTDTEHSTTYSSNEEEDANVRTFCAKNFEFFEIDGVIFLPFLKLKILGVLYDGYLSRS